MNQRGFTLVELLVAIGIVLSLMAMAMPLLTMASRQAKRSNTQATLAKLDAAIRQFRRDIDVLPYQASYPDAVDATTPFVNNLAVRLGRDLSGGDRIALDALTVTAAGKYGYPENVENTAANETATLPSNLTYRVAWAPPSWAWQYGGAANYRYLCKALNRMGQARATGAVRAGAFDLRGGVISENGTVISDLTSRALLTSAEIGTLSTGWCGDYLHGEIEASARTADGNGIRDAWGNPLVYVCQVVPKAKSASVRVEKETRFGLLNDQQKWHNELQKIDEPNDFGLGALGYAVGTGPWAQLQASGRFYLLGVGRLRLSQRDAGDGLPTPAHASLLPDAADLRASDRRYYAAPGLETDFELWSAGPDGRLAWMRSALVNRDNVSAVAYDRGLP